MWGRGWVEVEMLGMVFGLVWVWMIDLMTNERTDERTRGTRWKGIFATLLMYTDLLHGLVPVPPAAAAAAASSAGMSDARSCVI